MFTETPNIFDLLEEITEGASQGSEAWKLKGGYSRNTGGVDMEYLVRKLREALASQGGEADGGAVFATVAGKRLEIKPGAPNPIQTEV